MRKKLDFIKRVLTDTLSSEAIRNDFFLNGTIPSDDVIDELLKSPVDPNRMGGLDWPERAHTMIGLKRLDNLHECLDMVRENNVQGDFIETGVWRGGASIFIKLYNDYYGMNRKVFVSDSFEGLPKPDPKFPQDNGDIHHTIDFLKVSLEEVQKNFGDYRVLDDDVVFIKGWFCDTLSNNDKIGKLSLLRFDGDMYSSTMDVFNNLYDKVVANGVVIVDDYCLPNCVKAVSDFRTKNGINDKINVVDSCGVYWVKS